MLSQLDLNPANKPRRYQATYKYFDASTFYQPLRWAINGVSRMLTGKTRYESHIMPREQMNLVVQKDIQEYTAKAIENLEKHTYHASQEDLTKLAQYTLHQVKKLSVWVPNRQKDAWRNYKSSPLKEFGVEGVDVYGNHIPRPESPIKEAPLPPRKKLSGEQHKLEDMHKDFSEQLNQGLEHIVKSRRNRKWIEDSAIPVLELGTSKAPAFAQSKLSVRDVTQVAHPEVHSKLANSFAEQIKKLLSAFSIR